jgi:hypothetical protein
VSPAQRAQVQLAQRALPAQQALLVRMARRAQLVSQVQLAQEQPEQQV